MRLLRTLAPLALVAAFATACGGSGSSAPATGGTSTPDASGTTLEVRPVYARYAPGVPFGPEIPKALVATLSHQKCPTPPRDVQGMLLECDAAKTVYLLKSPIVTGGVTSATPKRIGQEQQWSIRVTLDPTTKATLDSAVKAMTGTELAYSFDGAVVMSLIVDSSFGGDHLVVLGNYDKAQATKLAHRISAS